MVLFLLPLPLFLILSLVGPFLPPPPRKPVGVLYWISFLGFCGFLLLSGAGVVIAFIAQHSYDAHPEPVPGWMCVIIPLVVLAASLGLLANTLWGLGQAQKLPPDMPEEERREVLRRLSRRLWFPLSAAWVLFLVLPWLGLGMR